MAGSFFGTDGIRGRTSLDQIEEDEAIRHIEERRTLTPAFMRLVGEALSYTQPDLPGTGNTVVIGWDRRPHNPALVTALTLGLRLTGCRVIHIGECATPTLHHAVLAFAARTGCMITASHNPVTDSGIKVFNAYGYKSSRVYEDEVSRTIRQLAEEDREVDQPDREVLKSPDEAHLSWAETTHPAWLQRRWNDFTACFGSWSGQATSVIAPNLLVDAANGFASTWLVDFLKQQGVACSKVVSPSGTLNEGCGAGDFSPTQTWTFEEAKTSTHAMLQQLEPAPPGQLVGVALDGDGDRCLFIESTEHGFAVLDGDAMGAMLLSASPTVAWSFAASIESDVGLFAHATGVNPGTTCVETAVGDRWLSFALRPEDGGWLQRQAMPACCGIEDSGHVVLPSPHPEKQGEWGLVGDGAATLCAVLLARSNTDGAFLRGWKRRVSIANSRRARWHRESDLFATTLDTVQTGMQRLGFDVRQRLIDGEKDLLLVHGTSPDGVASFGVRNSGTQAKTSLSVRLSEGIDPTPYIHMLDEVYASLSAELVAS